MQEREKTHFSGESRQERDKSGEKERQREEETRGGWRERRENGRRTRGNGWTRSPEEEEGEEGQRREARVRAQKKRPHSNTTRPSSQFAIATFCTRVCINRLCMYTANSFPDSSLSGPPFFTSATYRREHLGRWCIRSPTGKR